MRLRSRDTEYHDESKRALGVAEFLRDLKDFLDVRVEGDGDGWAPVSREDHQALNDLIFNLIALKWGTDADGDLPFDFTTCNRNKGRLIHDTMPYSPQRDKFENDEDFDDAMDHYMREAARTIKFLLGSAEAEQRMFDFYFEERIERRQRKREAAAKLADVTKQVEERTDESQFATDQEAVVGLAKEEFKDNREALKPLQVLMARKYPKALERTLTEHFEVIKNLTTDNFPEFYETVVRPSATATHTFGRAYDSDPAISTKRTEMMRNGRTERAAQRSAAVAARTAVKTA